MLNKCVRSVVGRPAAARALFTVTRSAAAQQSVQAFQQQQGGEYYNYQAGKINFAHFLLPSLAFASYMYLHNSDSELAFAAQPSEKDNTKGVKENKIRFFGEPKQIYKYFASVKDEDGNDAMTYQDFFNALTPYNFTKGRDQTKYFQKNTECVNKIMHIADVDGDGQISFAEFYFFVLVCQTPSRMIAVDFKKAGGSMSVGKLAKTIGSHKLKTNFNQKTALSKKQIEEFLEVKIGMCQRIFAGRDKITFEEYIAFRNTLIETLWHYEFHQFDVGKGHQITNHDMAQSLYVYYIPFQKMNDYLLHLDKFKEHKKGCCNLEQYCAFQYFLRAKAKIIQVVMDKGKIDFDGLRELVDEFETENEYCLRTGAKITDEMLHAFLDAMDLDGNGVLDMEETVGILTTRKEIGSRQLKQKVSN